MDFVWLSCFVNFIHCNNKVKWLRPSLPIPTKTNDTPKQHKQVLQTTTKNGRFQLSRHCKHCCCLFFVLFFVQVFFSVCLNCFAHLIELNCKLQLFLPKLSKQLTHCKTKQKIILLRLQRSRL